VRFNIEQQVLDKYCGGVHVGDMYAARGGNNSPCFWVVIARTERSKTVKCLGIGDDGEIVSTASYYEHYFSNRAKVGFVRNIDEMILDVEIFGDDQ